MKPYTKKTYIIGLLIWLVMSSALAQNPIRYIYDDLGRLSKAIDPSGNVATYVYDPLGNILEIRRSVAGPLAIFGFTPSRGTAGDTVVIEGQGFSATVGDNTVSFNGASAVVDAASAEQLTVTVPAGATTGPISVQVGANNAASDMDFIVLPGITSITPQLILQGAVNRPLQVTGAQLNGASFSFQPQTLPPAIAIDSTTVDSSGTSASLVVDSNPDFSGSYVLVADTLTGQSSTAPAPGNTLTVIALGDGVDDDGDGLSNEVENLIGTDPLKPDTDNDGFSDADEALYGTDPLDPASNPIGASGSFYSSTLSVINLTLPANVDGFFYSSALSVINLTPPSGIEGSFYSSTLSVINTTDPNAIAGHAEGPVLSVENIAP